MEKGATFSKNRELFVILILCADRIAPKTLSDGRGRIQWQNDIY